MSSVYPAKEVSITVISTSCEYVKVAASKADKNILFIVSGAFDQLAEDVKKRLDLNRIGFGSTEEGQEAELPLSSFLSKAETRDFINYGFEPELLVVYR